MSEKSFLAAIMENPNDHTARGVYADWLDDNTNEKEKAEFLRLTIEFDTLTAIPPELIAEIDRYSLQLAHLRAEHREALNRTLRFDRNATQEELNEYTIMSNEVFNSEAFTTRRNSIQEIEKHLKPLQDEVALIKLRPLPVRTRLQELAANLDPNWLAIVGDPVIEGCANSNRGNRRLRFDFICPMSWADLKPTENERIRTCEKCKENVHFCDNLAEAREHSYDGHCIAIDLGIKRIKDHLSGDFALFGRSSRQSHEENWRTNLDEVSKKRLEAKKKRDISQPLE